MSGYSPWSASFRDAHDQQLGLLAGPVPQAMAVAHAGLDARRIAGDENFLSGIGHQHDFTAHHVHETLLDFAQQSGPANRRSAPSTSPRSSPRSN